MQLKIDLDTLSTGDILLFKGSAWYDKLIEKLGRSQYSHVAMVLKDPIYINPEFIGIYVIESGFEYVADEENHEFKIGVQIHKLSTLLQINKYDTLVRKANITLDIKELENIIKNVHKEVHGIPYDMHLIDWVRALEFVDIEDLEKTQKWCCIRNKHEMQKTNTFWCSAFVTYLYYKMGLLEKDTFVPWTLISPREFSSHNLSSLKFVNCNLEPEIKIN